MTEATRPWICASRLSLPRGHHFPSPYGNGMHTCETPPVLTSLGTGSTAPVAWPQQVLAQVVDECGGLVNTGTVTASFTNGDAAIPLVAIGGGFWSGTWTPVRSSAAATVRVDAQTPQPIVSALYK